MAKRGLALVATWLAVSVSWSAPTYGADVSGDWQVNIDCGLAATATSFLTLTGTTGSSAVEATTPECGTLEVPGEIVEILSCTSTPEPRIGSNSGTSLTIPPSGVFRSDSLFTPFTFPFLLCPADRVVSDHRYNGTVVDDGAGVAVSISGTLFNTLLRVYRPDGSICIDIADTLDCTFDMRRNRVATGSNVTLSPRAGASVTFETVTAPGTAAVVPLTAPSATVPASFAVLGEGGVPIFYDVKTNAEWSGSVESCFAYGDANNDGLVDQNGQPEADLRVLHDEGGVFVDRTSGLDTVGNVICGETSSLSQLVVAGGPAQPTGCSAAPLSCKRSTDPNTVMLQISDKSGTDRDKLFWRVSKGEDTGVGQIADPFNGEGYWLCIYDESGGTPALVYQAVVPSNASCTSPPCWSSQASSSSLRYKAPAATPEGIRQVLLRPGAGGRARVVVKGKGPHLANGPLGFPPLPLPLPARVQLQYGERPCWEAEYTGAGVQRNDGSQFKGRASGP